MVPIHNCHCCHHHHRVVVVIAMCHVYRLEAQVIKVFPDDNLIRIHYKGIVASTDASTHLIWMPLSITNMSLMSYDMLIGWKEKYDENLSTQEDHRDASRIARLFDKQAERADRLGNVTHIISLTEFAHADILE
jgi:hypothetical protein